MTDANPNDTEKGRAREMLQAAIGDRLLAEGPLSKEYAYSVINEATAVYDKLLAEIEGVRIGMMALVLDAQKSRDALKAEVANGNTLLADARAEVERLKLEAMRTHIPDIPREPFVTLADFDRQSALLDLAVAALEQAVNGSSQGVLWMREAKDALTKIAARKE